MSTLTYNLDCMQDGHQRLPLYLFMRSCSDSQLLQKLSI